MSFLELLQRKKVLLSDGAFGTELAKKGHQPGVCPELLNVDEPDIILDIAMSYVNAGSDIILTDSFGGSSFKLKKYGLGSRVAELNEASVKIAKQAAADQALVFASVGSTGEFLAPLGLTSEEDMIAVYAEQVKALVAGGADGVVLETMTDLGEIICALRAVKDNSDLPAICSMTFDKGPKGYATMMGIRPEAAAPALEKAGADGVGSNCGSGIENMIEIAALMQPETTLPLWIKPNAGLPELIDGKTVYRETPEEMASRIPELIENGATIIGGCCGTSPEHIANFRKAIDAAIS